MHEARNVRSATELLGSQVESKEISRTNIEAYIEGCEELAVRLDTVIGKVGESGKRPVILIPSRGAVPIFLEARRFLEELHGEGSVLSGRNARYYPNGIFDYLEEKEPQKPDQQTTVDVVLFPFTADVSLESTDDEIIAKELRNSCARSVMQIVRGVDYQKHDYEWYKFLMKKILENPGDPSFLKPKEIIKSLESFNPNDNSQIILIDTVISGRAANDITNVFKALGHTVVPLLAVDNTKGGKFDQRRRAEIQGTLRSMWHMLPNDDLNEIFVEFPLITEDRGAALLGVVALNFVNFNKEGVFHKVSSKFPSDFRPQSCVWTLPPRGPKELYLPNFRRFMDVAWRCRNGSPDPCTHEEINKFRTASKPLTSGHLAPSYQEVSTQVSIDKSSELKETASHIVSVKLSEKQGEQWIKEFAGQSHSAP